MSTRIWAVVWPLVTSTILPVSWLRALSFIFGHLVNEKRRSWEKEIPAFALTDSHIFEFPSVGD
jgi:hypothetical protein